MAYQGDGNFARPVSDYVFDTVISETDVNAEMDGIATGLSNAVTRDGQSPATANLPMATFKHTGVGAGSARTDYAQLGQTQDGKVNWVDGGGTADAITAAYSPPLTALVDGQECHVRATAANATTTPTFSPNGLTARTIVKSGGSALVAGDIAGDGHELDLRYDLANTRWELLNPAVPAANSAATTDAAGIVELATTAETQTGTDTARAVTPDGLHDMTSLTGAGWFLDQDDLSGDDATKVASQQSIKAYVDAQVAAIAPIWTYETDQSLVTGTGHTFSSLPEGIDTIEVILNEVSVDDTDDILIRIGDSGGMHDTGYVSTCVRGAATTTAVSNTTGFVIKIDTAGEAVTGKVTLTRMTGHKWVASGVGKTSDGTSTFEMGGVVTLDTDVDRLQLLDVGADNFDGGSINIRYQ
jgi:hypothetical protein